MADDFEEESHSNLKLDFPSGLARLIGIQSFPKQNPLTDFDWPSRHPMQGDKGQNSMPADQY